MHFQDNGEDYGYREGRYNLYVFSRDEGGALTTVMEHENYPAYEEIALSVIGR